VLTKACATGKEWHWRPGMMRSTLALTTAALVLTPAACQIPSTWGGRERRRLRSQAGRRRAALAGRSSPYGTDTPAVDPVRRSVTPRPAHADLRNRFILGFDPASLSTLAEAGGTAAISMRPTRASLARRTRPRSEATSTPPTTGTPRRDRSAGVPPAALRQAVFTRRTARAAAIAWRLDSADLRAV
jgi:hypothetical protein